LSTRARAFAAHDVALGQLLVSEEARDRLGGRIARATHLGPRARAALVGAARIAIIAIEAARAVLAEAVAIVVFADDGRVGAIRKTGIVRATCECSCNQADDTKPAHSTPRQGSLVWPQVTIPPHVEILNVV
jgi:hypothetical protein